MTEQETEKLFDYCKVVRIDTSLIPIWKIIDFMNLLLQERQKVFEEKLKEKEEETMKWKCAYDGLEIVNRIECNLKIKDVINYIAENRTWTKKDVFKKFYIPRLKEIKKGEQSK